MSTYKRLYEIVSPHLRNYRDDLEKHDREFLEKWDGPFLYGYRPTGTSILSLSRKLEDWFPDMMHKPIFQPRRELKDVDEALEVLSEEIIWITGGTENKWFLHFDGKNFKEITAERAKLIWRNYVFSLKTSTPFKMKNSVAITA